MCRKIYIDVVALHKKDGVTVPLKIIWEDGSKYTIDRVVSSRQAASLKVGGCGMRYTVNILGKQKYLFDEDGKWFVEKEN